MDLLSFGIFMFDLAVLKSCYSLCTDQYLYSHMLRAARSTFPPPWHPPVGHTASRRGWVVQEGHVFGSLGPISQERSGKMWDWPRWSTGGTHLHWCSTEAATCQTLPGWGQDRKTQSKSNHVLASKVFFLYIYYLLYITSWIAASWGM